MALSVSTIAAFSQELSKIAANGLIGDALKLTGGIAGIGAAGLYKHQASQRVNSAMSRVGIENSGRNEKLIKNDGANVALDPGKQPYYNQNSRQAVIGNEFAPPSLLAHELGHAELDKHWLSRAAQSTTATRLGMHGMPLGAVTGAVSGLSANPYIRALGVAAPAIAALPQLATEIGASRAGMRKLRALDLPEEEYGHSKQLLHDAFKTYAGRVGMGVSSALAAQGAVGYGRGIAAI
jgi:hypothetical protein